MLTTIKTNLLKGRFWYRLGSPLQEVNIDFEDTLPTVDRVNTELNKQTGLNYLFTSEGKEDNYEFIEVGLAGEPEENELTLCFDHNTNSVAIFYGMHQRYLPNAMIWILKGFGGISERKTPSWTKLKWANIRWWHLATDIKLMTWRIYVLIVHAVFICIAPIAMLIQSLRSLFSSKKEI